MIIGILSMQGAIEEHEAAFRKLDLTTLRVKKPVDLQSIDGLVFPGGESTTMIRLMALSGLFEPLAELIGRKKMPVYGTCAGMILLSKGVTNYSEQRCLGLIDIWVERNAFGRQIDSFEAPIMIDDLGKEAFPAVFIRAPLIRHIGPEVRLMATYRQEAIMARQDNVLVSAFHPELTGDLRIHMYFSQMVSGWRHSQS